MVLALDMEVVVNHCDTATAIVRRTSASSRDWLLAQSTRSACSSSTSLTCASGAVTSGLGAGSSDWVPPQPRRVPRAMAGAGRTITQGETQ